jgi:hypothetical protein
VSGDEIPQTGEHASLLASRGRGPEPAALAFALAPSPSREPVGMTHYTLRYRSEDGRGAFLVTDEQGAAYLFSGGYLQGRFNGDGACERLLALVQRHGTWVPVPEVSSVTVERLRQLVERSDQEAS